MARRSISRMATWAMLLIAAHASAQTMTPANPAALAQQIKADYAALTGRWQLVSGTVEGKPVPEVTARATVLITDHDVFRFPADAGVGTALQGKFTINPATKPKLVNSLSEAGPNKVRSRAASTSSMPTTSVRAGVSPKARARPISPARLAAAGRARAGG